jgi:O-acetylserine/cysteine efflux transporter
VISVIAASVWFGTPLTPVMIAGGVIVLAGVAIVTLRTAQAGEAKQN